ncbi:MAG TPA: nuclear transport factor 2 family protein [Thermoleophilaceae bacterium]|nr:nuclear transport factor 2 family protein [Thermoleophilaceae bacterium]
MSDALDLARSIYARWERGDFSDASWAAPDIECVNAFDGVSTRGVAEMAVAWRDWLAAWEEFSVTADEFVEIRDGVLVLTRFHGSGRTSGLSVDDLPGACHFDIRDGKVVRIRLYTDRPAAYAEVGLPTGR